MFWSVLSLLVKNFGHIKDEKWESSKRFGWANSSDCLNALLRITFVVSTSRFVLYQSDKKKVSDVDCWEAWIQEECAINPFW